MPNSAEEALFPHNFKEIAFEGTLIELFKKCLALVPGPDSLRAGEAWIEKEAKRAGALLPVRRSRPLFDGRGSQREYGGQRYLAIDNEPIAAFYDALWNAHSLPATIEEALKSRVWPVSYLVEYPEHAHGYRRGMVASQLRQFGYKLAHLENASKGISSDESSLPVRFLRTWRPTNLFPFPNYTWVTFQMSIPDKFAGSIQEADLAESPILQDLMRRYLNEERLGAPRTLDNEGWRRLAASIRISARPRKKEDRYQERTVVQVAGRGVELAETTESENWSTSPEIHLIDGEKWVAYRRATYVFRKEAWEMLQDSKIVGWALRVEPTAGGNWKMGSGLLKIRTDDPKAMDELKSHTKMATWSEDKQYSNSQSVPKALRRCFEPD